MKIMKYKYDNSTEELSLDELKKLYSGSPDLGFIPNVMDTKRNLELKLKEIEDKIFDYKKQLDNKKLYNVWFYFEPDIGNNGGVRTTIDEEQLKKLIKDSESLTNIYFLEIVDLHQLVHGLDIGLPEFVSDEIKKQLNNKEYNNWHSSLLKGNL